VDWLLVGWVALCMQSACNLQVHMNTLMTKECSFRLAAQEGT
jgi:hypothetical protein